MTFTPFNGNLHNYFSTLKSDILLTPKWQFQLKVASKDGLETTPTDATHCYFFSIVIMRVLDEIEDEEPLLRDNFSQYNREIT